jgi:hypothetical protein
MRDPRLALYFAIASVIGFMVMIVLIETGVDRLF